MKRFSFLSLFVFLLVASPLSAINAALAEAHFAAGNMHLAAEEPLAAIAEFEQALTFGASPAVYFNLGNAWFAQGEPARALLAYEQTLALQPSHPEAAHNRGLALKRLGQTDVPAPWWRGWALAVPTLNWWIACGSAAVLFGFVIAASLARRRLPLTSLWVVLALASMAISGAALSFWQTALLQGRFVSETALRVAPTAESPTTLKVPLGHAGQALNRVGDYWLVQLPEGTRGYARKDEFVPLFPGE